MSQVNPAGAVRPEPDRLLQQIADYVFAVDRIRGEEAIDTARLCLMDTLGCGLLALNYPACTKLLGPVVAGATMPGAGARVPGTSYELDPVRAAFNIGAMVRWLDFNDTWLAAEWGHPSDNLGGILAVADYFSRTRAREGEAALTIGDVLVGMIQAHEIQGVLALENALNRVGLDHVLLVRRGQKRYRHDALGSVIKINHFEEPIPPAFDALSNLGVAPSVSRWIRAQPC